MTNGICNVCKWTTCFIVTTPSFEFAMVEAPSHPRHPHWLSPSRLWSFLRSGPPPGSSSTLEAQHFPLCHAAAGFAFAHWQSGSMSCFSANRRRRRSGSSREISWPWQQADEDGGPHRGQARRERGRFLSHFSFTHPSIFPSLPLPQFPGPPPSLRVY